MNPLLFAALAVVVAPGVLPAAIVFDLEDQSPTALPRTGALTELIITQSGFDLTISRPGSTFDIMANVGSQAKAAEFGRSSLDSFFAETSATPFVVGFSVAVTEFSVDMGDYGGDMDALRVEAFTGNGGTGTSLGVVTQTLPADSPDFEFRTISFSSATPFLSVRMVGGDRSFPNSVFYDNLTVTPVPSSLGLCLIATWLMWGRMIRHPLSSDVA